MNKTALHTALFFGACRVNQLIMLASLLLRRNTISFKTAKRLEHKYFYQVQIRTARYTKMGSSVRYNRTLEPYLRSFLL